MKNPNEGLPEIVEELRNFLDNLKSNLDGAGENGADGESAAPSRFSLFPCSKKSQAERRRKARVDQLNSWNEFKANLEQRSDDTVVREILRYEFEREEKIMKSHKENGKKVPFKTYTSKDTVLNKALRMTPPKDVLKYFEKVLPAYKKSRALFEIARKMVLTDNRWKDFTYEYSKMEKEDLPQEDVEHILKIRHTDEEHTILAIAVRRDPPLEVIKILLKGCKEALSLPHIGGKDGLYAGWIPLHFALQFQASSEVAIALIPGKSDVENSDFLKQIDVLDSPDYHGRTLLHWAAYHNASPNTIDELKKSCPEVVLRTEDHCGHAPYQTAIWHGRPMHVVEQFFVPGCVKGDHRFEDVLARLTRSLIDKAQKGDPEARVTKDESGNEGEKDKRYTYIQYDLPSIIDYGVGRKAVREAVAEISCKSLPVFLTMFELYNYLMLIVSYHFYTEKALSGRDIMHTSELWFFLLCLSISIMAVREIAEMLATQARWFMSIWNYLDVATVSLAFTSAVRIYSGHAAKELGLLLVITNAFIWIDAISFLRSTFESFAVFVGGVFKIITDLVPFIIVAFLILVAFADMFKLESLTDGRCSSDTQESRYLKSGLGKDTNLNATGTYCTVEEAVFRMYWLSIYGMDVTEYAESRLMKAISIVFTFLVSVILLNIVIAILSTSWADVVKQSKKLYWKNRLEFLVEVRRYGEFLDRSLWRHSSNGEDTSSENPLQNLLDAMDRKLARVCQPFWPGQKYSGKFDSMFKRICGSGPGSFQVQLIYQFAVNPNKESKIFILLKAAILMIVFWTFALIWFIAGLFTFGLLWPSAIRTFLFGNFLSDDTEDPSHPNDLDASVEEKIGPKDPTRTEGFAPHQNKDLNHKEKIALKGILHTDTIAELNKEQKIPYKVLVKRLKSIHDEVGHILLQIGEVCDDDGDDDDDDISFGPQESLSQASANTMNNQW